MSLFSDKHRKKCNFCFLHIVKKVYFCIIKTNVMQ